ncbi:TfoX/Sxy family protein [Parapedobacter tibetensis]|uniref:TfoX/Sxy family protein n=1 Tax=Parapedobacter tibetensis TaxID=2972951 RepID=UPI00214DD7D6|nr:TfoX/Sxy family protein [Parapedobacter tibetensis]
MAFNENLVNRIRELLVDQLVVKEPAIEEKAMFQGLCFMVNDKMCICVKNSELLCRIGEVQAKPELEKDHCRQAVMGGRVMKDFVYVDGTNVQFGEGLNYWITLCLQFNGEAKSSKRKSPKAL